MNDSLSNRRSEARHSLRTTAIVHRKTGTPLLGSTVNVSGSGVLLDLDQPADLILGEEVACSIQLYEGRSPQSWGTGKIVRVDRSRVAIEFKGIE